MVYPPIVDHELRKAVQDKLAERARRKGIPNAQPVPAHIRAYMDRISDLEAVGAWVKEALAEQDFLDFEEPYRLSH